MNLFYFNHLTPENTTNELVSSAFSTTYKEYSKLRKRYPNDVDGIVTSADAHQVFLIPNQFSLAQCISSMERSMRFAAFGAFTKYPFNNHFTEVNEEEMVINNYSLTIEGSDLDAYYLKVVADNLGFAFSLGLCDDLRTHPLTINCDNGSVTSINNLYGTDANTTIIEEIIVQSVREKLGNFDRLLNIAGDNLYSTKFKNSFEKLPVEAQNSVIACLEKAINRGKVSKFYPDDDLIKDVTSNTEKEIKVCELRIFDPIALRLYFYETSTEVILASIEKKPTKKGRTNEQDNQIKSAASTIKQTLILNKNKNKK